MQRLGSIDASSRLANPAPTTHSLPHPTPIPGSGPATTGPPIQAPMQPGVGECPEAQLLSATLWLCFLQPALNTTGA